MNRKLPTKSLIFFITIFFSFCFLFKDTFAQINSSSLSITSPISDADAVDGDIICSYTDGNKRCNSEYDLALLGVINENAALELEDSGITNGRPLVTSGIATVRVSSVNGNIAEGDFITSSIKEGVGQKAIRNGFVIGVAIEEYESEDTEATGKIQVLINIHPESKISGSRGNLLQFIRSGLSVPVFEPVEALRYLLAVAMVLISFTLGMIYFGKASRAGIEAIGRNPLAKRVIQLTVVLNVLLTLIIVGVGISIAYLILVL